MSFDVIIIGSGQAGVPLATKLADAGKTVLIAERASAGGTCINTGCTPTKTMIASARAAHVARTAGRLGVRAGNVTVDFAAVVARKDQIVREWSGGIKEKLSSHGKGLRFVEGHARFVGAREVEVNGERHRADAVVINVGARPALPKIPGLDSVPFLDNKRALELRELPSHLLLLGGGYIGCELGQLFRRFGSEVTIVDPAEHLMSREDPEVSAEIEKVFRAEGIGLELKAEVKEISKSERGVRMALGGGKTLEGSHLLVATGRRPNTDDLGCDAAGIELDERGFITVDGRYQTSAKGVYAVGDVIPQPQFTHTSWDDHRLVFDVLMGRRPARSREGRLIPYTGFTDPQIAGVGLTEKEAKKKGVAYEAASMPFGEIARALEVDETAGILKVLIDPKSGRLIGASIVGAEAGELIHVFVALMQAKADPRTFVDGQVVHPTFAEGVQSVLMRFDRFTRPAAAAKTRRTQRTGKAKAARPRRKRR